MELNPYAPPSVDNLQAVDLEEKSSGQAWQNGSHLVISRNAPLGNRCFATGSVTASSIELALIYFPKWVYLLLPAGILPYFMVRGYLKKSAEIQVPISAGTNARHRKMVMAGTLSTLLGILFLAVGGAFINEPGLIIVLSFSLLFVGFIWSSRLPVPVKVVALTDHLLVIGGVHQDSLDQFPPWPHQDYILG